MTALDAFRIPDALLIAAGAALLLLALFDVLVTALLPRGAGPVSERLMGGVWRVCLVLHRRRPMHRTLSYVGALMLLLTVATWTGLVWLGASLLLLSDPAAVVRSSDGAAVGAWERVYFAGYTLVTLGNGEFRPDRQVWRVFTVLLSAWGFSLFTLGITYLLTVLSAVSAKRALANHLACLGLAPADVVERHYGPGAGADLAQQVPTLLQGISTVAQQHLAYPVLHYMHATEFRNALPLRMASLDEALRLITHALPSRQADASRLEPLRDAVGGYLLSLEGLIRIESDEAPPPPDLERLRERGLEPGDPAAFREALGADEERRRLLLALVRRDGWEWHDLQRDGSSP